MQGREAVGFAVAHVELVRELVDHDVVAGHARILVARHGDVLVGKDHGAAQPRLARHGIVGEVDDAGFVHDLALGRELRRIHDHVRPAVVPLDAEFEHEDRGLRGDVQAHLVGDLEAVGPASSASSAMKASRQGLEPRLLGGIEAAHEKPLPHQEGEAATRLTEPDPSTDLFRAGSP